MQAESRAAGSIAALVVFLSSCATSHEPTTTEALCAHYRVGAYERAHLRFRPIARPDHCLSIVLTLGTAHARPDVAITEGWSVERAVYRTSPCDDADADTLAAVGSLATHIAGRVDVRWSGGLGGGLTDHGEVDLELDVSGEGFAEHVAHDGIRVQPHCD